MTTSETSNANINTVLHNAMGRDLTLAERVTLLDQLQEYSKQCDLSRERLVSMWAGKKVLEHHVSIDYRAGAIHCATFWLSNSQFEDFFAWIAQ